MLSFTRTVLPRCAAAPGQGAAFQEVTREVACPLAAGAGLGEEVAAADSAPARGWRSSQRLGGSENAANTCLEEGQKALEQLPLRPGAEWAGKGAEPLSRLLPHTSQRAEFWSLLQPPGPL